MSGESSAADADVDVDAEAATGPGADERPLLDRDGALWDAGLVLAALVGMWLLFAFLELAGAGFELNAQTVNAMLNSARLVTFFAAAYAMLALALNLHWGYTGLFNIGVAGFMAVGVYTMGMLTGSPSANPPGLGLPLPVGIVGGMVAAALVGLVAALPALRLRADYLAIVTLGFSEIIRLTANSNALSQWTIEHLGFGTGGGSGLGLPLNPVQTAFRDVAFLAGLADAAVDAGLRRSIVIDVAYVLVLAVFVVAFYWLLSRIGNSPFGRVLKAIREDELAARSLGKDTRAFKIKVFMLGCALMGLAGILWQGSYGFVNPNSFRPIVTFYVFVAVIVGGSGSNTGSVVGSILFVGLLFEGPRRVGSVVSNALDLGSAPGTLAAAAGPLAGGDAAPLLAYVVGNIASLQFVLLGVVLVVLMQNRPEGVLGHRTETAAAVDLSERPVRGDGRGAGGGSDE